MHIYTHTICMQHSICVVIDVTIPFFLYKHAGGFWKCKQCSLQQHFHEKRYKTNHHRSELLRLHETMSRTSNWSLPIIFHGYSNSQIIIIQVLVTIYNIFLGFGSEDQQCGVQEHQRNECIKDSHCIRLQRKRPLRRHIHARYQFGRSSLGWNREKQLCKCQRINKRKHCPTCLFLRDQFMFLYYCLTIDIVECWFIICHICYSCIIVSMPCIYRNTLN